MRRMNDTEPNRRGLGRTLDNGFRRLASSLEKGAGKLAYHAGLGPYAKAERNLSVFDIEDLSGVRDGENVCRLILGYARSYNPAIQFMAFVAITRLISTTHSLHFSFRRCLGSQESIPNVIRSWKRPNISYSRVWQHMHELVFRCLGRDTATSNSVILTSFAKLNRNWNCRVDFSKFAIILSHCRDIHDDSLTIEFMVCAWNGKGISAYVEKNGYGDPILFNCAKAIERGYERAFESLKFNICFYCRHFLRLVDHFTSEMWASARVFTQEKMSGLVTHDLENGIWAVVFKLFCISNRFTNENVHINSPLTCSATWGNKCLEELPDNRHAEFRDALMQLQEIYTYEGAFQRRFPPPA